MANVTSINERSDGRDVTSSSLRVQGTNDNSIVSKLSMIQQNYVEDPYLKNFVKKAQRRSPLINRGYYIRTKAVRHVVEKFISARAVTGQVQVVSLGAGFDTMYFWVKDWMKTNAPSAKMKYIEIDFPGVMHRKVNLASDAGLITTDTSAPPDSGIIFSSSDYTAIGFDLRHIGQDLKRIFQIAQVDFSTPTLFVSEVVLTYLTSGQSSKVFRWISYNFSDAILLVFEQMLPLDGFGKVMLRHFENIGSPLLSINAFPSLRAQLQRHQRLGFQFSSACDLHSLCRILLSDDEKERIHSLEMFDEYEGWHQMCFHYFVACSTNSKKTDLQEFCLACLEHNNIPDTKAEEEEIPLQLASAQTKLNSTVPVQIYGHCACGVTSDQDETLESSMIVLYGGFGVSVVDHHTKSKSAGSHRRLSDLCFLRLKTGDVTGTKIASVTHTMYSTMVLKPGGEKGRACFVVFGGRASPVKATNELILIGIKTDDLLDESSECTLQRPICSDSSSALPSARWRHTSCVLPRCSESRNSDCMLVFGGRDNDQVFGDFWKLDLERFEWTRIDVEVADSRSSNPIIFARHSHCANLWKTGSSCSLLISGGLAEKERPQHDILRVHFRDNAIATAERFEVHPILPARYSHSSHILRDRYLILVGGVRFLSFSKLSSTPDCLMDEIHVVDLISRSWMRTVSVAPAPTAQPVLLFGHKSVISAKGVNDCTVVKLTVIGGGANCFSFGTAFNQSPLTIEFTIDCSA